MIILVNIPEYPLLSVVGGPDPVLILQPSRSFYHIDVGKTLPSIKCSADCKPVCNISWTNAEKGSAVSTNGLLSPGPVTEENSGEYLCTANKEGTYKQASKSIFILLKQKKGKKNTYTRGVWKVRSTVVFLSNR